MTTDVLTGTRTRKKGEANGQTTQNGLLFCGFVHPISKGLLKLAYFF